MKPAEEACLTALAFADICNEAGLPAGALNVVPGLGEEAGAALSGHPDIDHISFTGSVPVGAMIQEAAARNIVPVTLELGGKSPQLVFADADIDKAVPFLVNAGIQNAGQTCSASSRILVHRSRYDEVVARMAERYAALKVGPAMADLDVGPLISARQEEIVSAFLTATEPSTIVAEGRIAGDVPAGGHYLAPALVAGVGCRPQAGAGRGVRPDPGRHPLRQRRGSRCHGQRYAVRSCRQRLDRRRVAPDAPRQAAQGGSGSSSTITVPPAVSNCPSAVSASPGTDAKRASRRSTASPSSKPSLRIMARENNNAA